MRHRSTLPSSKYLPFNRLKNLCDRYDNRARQSERMRRSSERIYFNRAIIYEIVADVLMR
jgi:hypothetical protein